MVKVKFHLSYRRNRLEQILPSGFGLNTGYVGKKEREKKYPQRVYKYSKGFP